MSHFTNIKTRFKDLDYLEKSLNKLEIENRRETQSSSVGEENVLICMPQSNGYNAYFSWNGSEYDLVFDVSFWEQSCSIESFIDKITQQYVSEVIAAESQLVGFQPTKYVSNLDGSRTLVLQRWKN